MRGGGIVPGPGESSSTSYRGELAGLLGLVAILATMETLISPPHPYSIRIACDGLSALSKSLLMDQEYFNFTHANFDLISHIIQIKTHLQAVILPIHVRGHQDSKGLKA